MGALEGGLGDGKPRRSVTGANPSGPDRVGRARRSRLTTSIAPSGRTARFFWGTAASVILIDQVTKVLAEQLLAPRYVPHRIIGDVVRFTLAYNPGAAFSMSLGPYSRYIFGAFAIVALVVLWRLYRMTGSGGRPGDGIRILALGLAWGGAAGNLIDRIRSPLGVVDFIDIGYRDVRFWTFNVADSAVTIGALALAWSLSREEHDQRAATEAAARQPDGAAPAPAAGDGRALPDPDA